MVLCGQVRVITEEMEAVVLADTDHSIDHPHGIQKRLVFYCLVGLGIRGGQELWNLMHQDLSINVDKEGKDFVSFEERESKNNNYTLERYSEEQFHNVYHSYEVDFVLCVRQYYRHLPLLEGETKPDLFLGPITNPAMNVWFNRTHKVARDRASGWLKNMLRLVGLPEDLFSNKSGRATLITRMVAKGVPDQVGMIVSGHRTVGGYERYDRTKLLKIVVATLASSRSDLSYEMALTEVAKKFMQEDIVGNTGNLKPLTSVTVTPLLAHISGTDNIPPVICTDVTEGSGTSVTSQKNVKPHPQAVQWHKDNEDRITKWHKDMEFDVDAYLASNPDVRKHLGGIFNKSENKAEISGGNSISGSQKFEICTIIFNCGGKKDDN